MKQKEDDNTLGMFDTEDVSDKPNIDNSSCKLHTQAKVNSLGVLLGNLLEEDREAYKTLIFDLYNKEQDYMHTFPNLVDGDVIQCDFGIGDTLLKGYKFYIKETENGRQLRSTYISSTIYFNIDNAITCTSVNGKSIKIDINGCNYSIDIVDYLGNLVDNPSLIGCPF